MPDMRVEGFSKSSPVRLGSLPKMILVTPDFTHLRNKTYHDLPRKVEKNRHEEQ